MNVRALNALAMRIKSAQVQSFANVELSVSYEAHLRPPTAYMYMYMYMHMYMYMYAPEASHCVAIAVRSVAPGTASTAASAASRDAAA